MDGIDDARLISWSLNELLPKDKHPCLEVTQSGWMVEIPHVAKENEMEKKHLESERALVPSRVVNKDLYKVS